VCRRSWKRHCNGCDLCLVSSSGFCPAALISESLWFVSLLVCVCALQRTHLVNLRSFSLRVRDRASGDEISQPKRDQCFYNADSPQTELAFYLHFVLPRYGVGQISNVVILNSALESEKV
jgi:hypothetical protein